MSLEKLEKLKSHYQNLQAEERLQLTESLHKIHLGVEQEEDIKTARAFLQAVGLKMRFEAKAVAELIDYIREESSQIPEHLIYEESITENVILDTTVDDLPRFDDEDAETLKDEVKPLK